jgi:transcriptional regulator with GAF, ATPase, and Fis domain
VARAINLRLADLLTSLAGELVDALGAQACAVSRVLGDVLILVAEHAPPGTTLQLGQGYLVSDFPQTGEVLDTGTPRTLTLNDPDVDAAEASVLNDLGFGALLMMRLELNGSTWGLVEVYREAERPFSADEVRRAEELLNAAAINPA